MNYSYRNFINISLILTSLAFAPYTSAEEDEESSDKLAGAGEDVASVETEIPDWLLEATETEEDEDGLDLTGLAIAGVATAGAGLARTDEEEAETALEGDTVEELPEQPVISDAVEEADWLSGLDEPESLAVEETPDWLAGASDAPPVEAEEASQDEAWLTDMPESSQVADSVVPSTEEQLVSPTAEEEMEIPDWLSELRESAEQEEEAPDWLAELTGESSSDIEPEAEEADWLTEMDSVQPELEEDDTPDWLAGVVRTEADQEEVPQPEHEAETPDVGEVEAAVAPAEGAETDAEMPDWLADLPVPSGEAESEAEFPEWLVMAAEKSPVLLIIDAVEKMGMCVHDCPRQHFK